MFGGDAFKGLERAIIIGFWTTVILGPLGLWKLIELIMMLDISVRIK